MQSVAGAMVALDGTAKVGVMVSGGGDSVALLHLMHRLSVQKGWQVQAVTVDHGLRPEAAAEAAAVARLCADLGVPHRICKWTGPEATGNLMDQARRARFALVADWAQGAGIGHVVMGHTADDQAESFLMGLTRASGVDGLSGMRKEWRDKGLVWLRPMLALSRADLRGYLRGQEIEWVDDPTNEDQTYARVRARKALIVLQDLGIDAAGLAQVSDHLDMVRQALTDAVAAAAHGAEDGTGALRFDRAQVLALPEEVQRRLWIAALRWISGAQYPPRAAGLAAVQQAIAQGRSAVLGGCRFRVTKSAVSVLREANAVAGLQGPSDAVWDGRWHLTGPHAPDLRLRALGATGLAQCKTVLGKDWRPTGALREALLVSPAVWRNEVLIAAPVAGFAGGWTAGLGQSFHDFILSH